MPDPTWVQGPPKIILLATDLSSRCDRALDRATQLAARWGARLVVLHVLEPEDLSLVDPHDDLPSWRRPRDPAALAADQIRRDLREGVPDLQVRVERGRPDLRIDEVAREVGAELIVTGVARDEALGRYVLGTTVLRLVRRTRTPVLVVKRRVRPYAEVLVATDFSDCSRHALDAAMAFFPDLPKTLLHAYDTPFSAFLNQDDAREQYRAFEQQACDRFLAESGLSPEQRRGLQVLLEHGAPEAMVRAYMQDRDVDLVVVGTHGRSAVFDTLIGSTARRILEASPGDVLLVRDPRAAS